jgi:hypothetical protein
VALPRPPRRRRAGMDGWGGEEAREKNRAEGCAYASDVETAAEEAKRKNEGARVGRRRRWRGEGTGPGPGSSGWGPKARRA